MIPNLFFLFHHYCKSGGSHFAKSLPENLKWKMVSVSQLIKPWNYEQQGCQSRHVRKVTVTASMRWVPWEDSATEQETDSTGEGLLEGKKVMHSRNLARDTTQSRVRVGPHLSLSRKWLETREAEFDCMTPGGVIHTGLWTEKMAWHKRGT